MDYESYWERSPCLVEYYREAHELRNIQRNQEMFLQGRYNYEAFQSVINAFSWGLGGSKGEKPKPYRTRPIPITKTEIEEEKKRLIQETLDWVEKGQNS